MNTRLESELDFEHSPTESLHNSEMKPYGDTAQFKENEVEFLRKQNWQLFNKLIELNERYEKLVEQTNKRIENLASQYEQLKIKLEKINKSRRLESRIPDSWLDDME
ncbi:MAG: hypothetical protein GF411_05940 [Candidatus Lokiarchaeota archaeon]|nr:hypothetical protein [Candidatus Lokiarchaeota archaeon]